MSMHIQQANLLNANVLMEKSLVIQQPKANHVCAVSDTKIIIGLQACSFQQDMRKYFNGCVTAASLTCTYYHSR